MVEHERRAFSALCGEEICQSSKSASSLQRSGAATDLCRCAARSDASGSKMGSLRSKASNAASASRSTSSWKRAHSPCAIASTTQGGSIAAEAPCRSKARLTCGSMAAITQPVSGTSDAKSFRGRSANCKHKASCTSVTFLEYFASDSISSSATEGRHQTRASPENATATAARTPLRCSTATASSSVSAVEAFSTPNIMSKQSFSELPQPRSTTCSVPKMPRRSRRSETSIAAAMATAKASRMFTFEGPVVHGTTSKTAEATNKSGVANWTSRERPRSRWPSMSAKTTACFRPTVRTPVTSTPVVHDFAAEETLNSGAPPLARLISAFSSVLLPHRSSPMATTTWTAPFVAEKTAWPSGLTSRPKRPRPSHGMTPAPDSTGASMRASLPLPLLPPPPPPGAP
mmetsp:Transcript_20256/g.69545  ORF Transcript_20256/g.69545 Transcript_20256/m.69545 type:complete len:402 (+) Transcript_20256:426-1631(+)